MRFRYQPDGPLILDDVTLRIEPGEFVAVVGPSGSGKSTLLRLLLGFEKPSEGGVYYDGQALASLDVRAARQQIGVVLAEQRRRRRATSTPTSWAAPGRNLEDAWRAARQAAFDKDVNAMPMGMHTLVSAGRSTLSGGQRQRLLIARALVANPRILFFDEATSALDNETQAVVSDSLDAPARHARGHRPPSHHDPARGSDRRARARAHRGVRPLRRSRRQERRLHRARPPPDAVGRTKAMRKVLFIFGQLSDTDVLWLARTGRRRRIKQGSVLIRERVPVDALYIVLEGELDVVVGADRRRVARLLAGEVVGEMSFIDARPPSATVSAATDAVVFTISKATLQQALAGDAAFAARFYRAIATFLSDRVREATAGADALDRRQRRGRRQRPRQPRSRRRALRRAGPPAARRIDARGIPARGRRFILGHVQHRRGRCQSAPRGSRRRRISGQVRSSATTSSKRWRGA